MKTEIKIAYIGGGSKMWAYKFMQDLALEPELTGEVRLYDIDLPAAGRNKIIGERIQAKAGRRDPFTFTVCRELSQALQGVDFVIISILPGTFKEMRSDVHAPEAYGIYQTVGDTAGPGGVLRAMRTVPLYEEFGRVIRDSCPGAWVLNLTNPMSNCVKALYRVFPGIRAFGCCHEVFHTQDLLCCVLKEITGMNADRREIYTDASGINHFTWIREARFQGVDLMELLPEFIDRHFEEGYYEHGTPEDWKTNSFAYGNRVKMDLFRRYGALAAAGDRHLVEFVDRAWYLKDRETMDSWHISLTTVDYREAKQEQLIREAEEMASGSRDVPLAASGEELVRLIRGILGLETVISNVNLPNRGQMPGIPGGAVVETNCIFTNGFVDPVVSGPLPGGALALVRRCSDNIDLLDEGIAERNLGKIFQVFVNQPLMDGTDRRDAEKLFAAMCRNTREYLENWYTLQD